MNAFVVFLVPLLAMFSVVGLDAVKEVKKLRNEAVARGYAERCFPDGRWAWVGECDD